ncbi:MAG: oligosaccharide flippase family protein [Calothrix sp. MO_167.B12]|nr:oligosaccharide flippase family protein [Calothrix sp. MO_167.B12]
MKHLALLKNRLISLFQHKLFRATLWMMSGRAIGIFMQAAYFILIARSLGKENLGIFMGVSAFAVVVHPFATLGSGDILIKNVSRNKDLFNEYWGNAIVTTLLSGNALILFAFFVAKVILPTSIPSTVIFFVLLSDILCMAISNLSGMAFISVNYHKITAKLQVIFNFNKLLAAITLAYFKIYDIQVWGFLYCLAAVTTAIVSVFSVNYMLGLPAPKLSRIKENIKHGIYFSLGISSDTINASIDKTMLASLSTLEATGLYAAAYRFIEVAYIPMLAMFGATYGKFFKEGLFGVSGTLKFAKRLIPIAFIYGIIAIIGYLLFAPFIAYLLGDKYIASIPILYWLSPMPFIIGIQWIAADTLTGAGYQNIRSILQLFTALLNLSLNYYLIPLYSWQGAAWSTLISDGLKMIFLWLIVYILYKKENNKEKII